MLLRSLGSGVSGLKNFQTYLDVVGNNISNVSTTGYKKARVNFEDLYSQQMQGATQNRNAVQIGLGAQTGSIDNIVTNSTPNQTGNPTDLAINGEGYFVVTDGTANYYTRAGDFKLNNNRELINAQGMRVVDDNGQPLPALPANVNVQSLTVAQNGTVQYLDANNNTQTLGTIGVTTFPNPAGLEKVGNSLFRATAASGNANQAANNGRGTIQQGALEASNVDLTDEMTNLIEAQRAYQANARTITTADQVLQELVGLKR
ncbi:flagellar hook-basal body complex protein [Sporolactobacillus sp. THM7-7]|nr:flagellar hook-basal body complex protein [Sporolactobacillus sp. THM7-7]